jgi:hypothetical protein
MYLIMESSPENFLDLRVGLREYLLEVLLHALDLNVNQVMSCS